MSCLYSTGVLLLALGWVIGSADASTADLDPRAASYEQAAEMIEERNQPAGMDASMLRQTIAALDLLTRLEREQLLPWLVNAIAQHTDVYVSGELTQEFNEKVASLGLATNAWEVLAVDEALRPEEIPGAAEEQASFEALLQRVLAPLPPEEEIRQQIEALTFDPEKPEVALTQAMEIAGVIERIEDEGVRLALRRVLEDRVMAFQAGW